MNLLCFSFLLLLQSVFALPGIFHSKQSSTPTPPTTATLHLRDPGSPRSLSALRSQVKFKLSAAQSHALIPFHPNAAAAQKTEIVGARLNYDKLKQGRAQAQSRGALPPPKTEDQKMERFSQKNPFNEPYHRARWNQRISKVELRMARREGDPGYEHVQSMLEHRERKHEMKDKAEKWEKKPGWRKGGCVGACAAVP